MSEAGRFDAPPATMGCFGKGGASLHRVDGRGMADNSSFRRRPAASGGASALSKASFACGVRDGIGFPRMLACFSCVELLEG
ncbi:MAG: hypothetical protein M2R45_03719 [Verrucomicrobia subdivision 3 bacterium]|nr:hypothetical protein [Limisphaerales bacterium]MCS1416957.1 hypothetical protein [Limisphaerales bacterium]